MFLRLAIKSLLHRKSSVLLTLFAMTLSIFVMLGVEHLRKQAKASFNHTISGVDLIVGARTSSLNLLLYSTFRIGSPTNNISWASFERIKSSDKVAWAIPISLGDSHKGYPVLGTNNDYFAHFKYGANQSLKFNKGEQLAQVFDVVLGFEIARKLGYQLGDKLTLVHGLVSTSFTKHSNKPFTVIGILNPTGTPVDQTLHISLQGLDSLHISPLTSMSNSNMPTNNNIAFNSKYTPKNITAFMIGLQSKMAIFSMQRHINTDDLEPLRAILPGVALSELWQTLSIVESSLRLISLLVFISAILGLSTMLLSSIKERSREIQLLRTIGATPLFVYGFIKIEAMFITLLSLCCAIFLLYFSLLLSKSYILIQYGISVNTTLISLMNLPEFTLVILCTFIAAIPASITAFKGE